MLVVRHIVKSSTIHGLGVFIMQSAKSGMVVWRYDPMYDVEIPVDLVKGFPSDVAETVFHHAEFLPRLNAFRLGNDADIFMNHSSAPSLIDRGDKMVAARDLSMGEELTCDYSRTRVLGFEDEKSSRNGCNYVS